MQVNKSHQSVVLEKEATKIPNEVAPPNNEIMTFDKLPNRPDKSKLMKKIIAYILEKRTRAFSYGFRVNFKKSLEMFFSITF